jgi:hypothetical protein
MISTEVLIMIRDVPAGALIFLLPASPGSAQTRSRPTEIEFRYLIGLLHCEFRIRPPDSI